MILAALMALAAARSALAADPASLPTEYGSWHSTIPCGSPTSNLKALLEEKRTPKLTIFGPVTGEFASSYLLPSPKTYEEPVAGDDDGSPDPKESGLWEWGCTYGPSKAWDGDPKTAWAESAGVGEVLLVPLKNAPDAAGWKARIWAGYGKSAQLFQANARPKKVRVHLICYRSLGGGDGDLYSADFLGPGKSLAALETTLKDFDGYQDLPLPKPSDWDGPDVCGNPREKNYLSDDRPVRYMVGIEILSVFPGTKYKDTAISEVGN